MTTFAVIASGPSLTQEQVDHTKHLITIAVNDSWKMVPHASHIYAADGVWWDENHNKITITAQEWTYSENAAMRYGLNWYRGKQVYNSGFQAVKLAIDLGAKRILLLGFDCHVKNGTHWHGDHKNTQNPDEVRCNKWVKQFNALDTKGVEIINCTPDSAITRFSYIPIDEAVDV